MKFLLIVLGLFVASDCAARGRRAEVEPLDPVEAEAAELEAAEPRERRPRER